MLRLTAEPGRRDPAARGHDHGRAPGPGPGCRAVPAAAGPWWPAHCPAALPGALLLEFSAQGHAYTPVRIRDSGCATVSGLGTARQWTWSSRPGRLLSGAVSGKGRLVPGTHPSSVPME